MPNVTTEIAPGRFASDGKRLTAADARASAAPVVTATAPRARVVVVDDEPLFRQTLIGKLADAGFEAIGFDSGPSMLEYVTANEVVDLVILDWKMPQMNGIEVLARLRSSGHHMPVIFLTGLSHQVYEEAALTGGAVDYVEKSRGFSILLRRAEMRLRRAKSGAKKAGHKPAGAAVGPLRVGPLEVRRESNRAYWMGKELALTLTEIKIVRILAERAGQDVSYRLLSELVQGQEVTAQQDDASCSTNMRSFVKRIRRCFTEIDPRFDRIENYAKFGYRWRTD